MARKKQRAVKLSEAGLRCRDCARSFDWQSPSFVDGRMILCRCPFNKHAGLYLDFLSNPACNHFTPRTNAHSK